MKFLTILLSVTSLVALALSKTFTRCGLARKMLILRVPKYEMAQWTCIAEHESSYTTNFVGPANSDGSNGYGIFQINNLNYCQSSNGPFSYNECLLRCEDLLSDDIRKDITCARQIQFKKGWTAWSTWRYCNDSLSSIDECF